MGWHKERRLLAAVFGVHGLCGQAQREDGRSLHGLLLLDLLIDHCGLVYELSLSLGGCFQGWMEGLSGVGLENLVAILVLWVILRLGLAWWLLLLGGILPRRRGIVSSVKLIIHCV